MLAVPCVERGGRQRSAKPTRFVVRPASNTIFTCVNVAGTQSRTPCSSLSMSKGVKLGSCWYSLFQCSICQRPFTRKPPACLIPYPVSQIHWNKQRMHTTAKNSAVPSHNLSLHGNFKP
ncbi:hypothetical protein MTO96_047563 [Rhipicephalus appendiculatus]|uniref:Uncharacterized protein n=1 Tax=Rhipicephalus appendiculatus TaxID=34631 RepID=A0A131YEW7_RHIAP